jgi:hypothetical protein
MKQQLIQFIHGLRVYRESRSSAMVSSSTCATIDDIHPKQHRCFNISLIVFDDNNENQNIVVVLPLLPILERRILPLAETLNPLRLLIHSRLYSIVMLAKTTVSSALAVVAIIMACSSREAHATPFFSSKALIKNGWLSNFSSNRHGISGLTVIPRGGETATHVETAEVDSDSAAVEEVLYLPGLLDVELVHSDHVRQMASFHEAVLLMSKLSREF